MKSPIAFFVPVLGCLLGCLFLSATTYAGDEVDRQLLPESSLSQDQQLQSGISPSQMTQQESINLDSTGDNIDTQDSAQQIKAKELEVELRKFLLMSCPR